MYDSVKDYQLKKKANWINHQLAQKLIVYCYVDNRLVVIRRVKFDRDSLVVMNRGRKITLKGQPIYATKNDFVNPVGTFRDKPLNVAEYVDLICRCIW